MLRPKRRLLGLTFSVSLNEVKIVEDRVDDGVTAYAGPPIVIEAWYAFGLDKICKKAMRNSGMGHDVLKSALGAQAFPPNNSGADAAWYRFNVLAFNLKTALAKVGLPKRAEA